MGMKPSESPLTRSEDQRCGVACIFAVFTARGRTSGTLGFATARPPDLSTRTAHIIQVPWGSVGSAAADRGRESRLTQSKCPHAIHDRGLTVSTFSRRGQYPLLRLFSKQVSKQP